MKKAIEKLPKEKPEGVLKTEAILNMLEDLQESRKGLEESHKELKKSENFTKNIIEHAGIPIIAFKRDDGLIIINKKFLGMTGYQKKEIDAIGKFFKLVFPSRLVKSKIDKALSLLYKGREINDFVIPLRCRDGSTIIVVSNVAPLYDENKKIIGEVMFIRDLSEIFELEKQIRYWAANGFVQPKLEKDGKKAESHVEISEPLKGLISKNSKKQ